MTKYEGALFVIVLLGTFLRLYYVGVQSLWGDETFSVWISRLSLSQIVAITAIDRHPPLYYFLLHYWMSWFGRSEVAVRLLSTVFSIIAIPMIYLIGRQLYDREVGLLSALILAVSVLNIQYAQETRMYSLMVLLALLSMYFFLHFLQRATLPIVLGYVFFTTLLLYTHVYDVFVVLAQNAYLATLLILPNRKFRIWHWISLQAIVVVLYAPWLINVIKQAIGLQGGGLYAIQPTIDTLPQALVAYSGTPLLTIFFVGLSVMSLFAFKTEYASGDWKTRLNALKAVSLKLRAENERSTYFLAVWLLIINVVPLLISLSAKSIYNYRYTIAASVALYVLVAAGIRNVNLKPAKLAVIGLVVVLSTASVSTYYTSYTKMQAREVFTFMNEHAEANDVVLLSPSDLWHVNQYYNTHHLNVTLFPEAGTVSQQEQVALKTSDHNRVWFAVNSFRPPIGAEVTAVKTLNATYNMTYLKNYTGFRLYLFETRT
ncbi:MAG: glycosyltransferase family 39 protein [Halobacteriota archaeon]